MSLESIQPVQPPHKSGGGLFGSLGTIAGAVVGAAAAPFTGGASVAAGAGLGAALGGAAGSATDTLTAPKAPTGTGDIPLNQSPPPAMNVMQNNPEVQLATVMDAKKAVNESGNIPGPVADQYHSILDQAANRLRTQVGANS